MKKLFLLIASAYFVTACILLPNSAKIDVPVGSIVRLHRADGAFFCSGSVVAKNRVLTAAHCVVRDILPGLIAPEQVSDIVVKDGAGNVLSQARVLGANSRSDVAMLEVDIPNLAPIAFIDNPASVIQQMDAGDLVICGYPYGGNLYCSPFRDVQMEDFAFSGSGHLYPGMSGGPCFNRKTGEIIGVNTAVSAAKSLISPLIYIKNMLRL